MPGSANLPGELATARQRRSRGLGGVGLGSRRGLPIPRTRIAASPLLGAASAVIVAGAALAAIVGGGGNHMLAAKQLATKQPSASSSHCACQYRIANAELKRFEEALAAQACDDGTESRCASADPSAAASRAGDLISE